MAAYDRLPNESSRAYAAFRAYMLLPARTRSIDAAFRSVPSGHGRTGAKQGQTRDGKEAPKHWEKWSSDHDWVRRAAAYDFYLAEQDRLLWEERRRQMREREWARGDALHDLVARALPFAEQFIHRRETEVNGQIVITLSFDVTGLSKVSLDASKLQRLATGDPTDRQELSGAALLSAIDAEFARRLALVDDDAAAPTAGLPTDAAADRDSPAL